MTNLKRISPIHLLFFGFFLRILYFIINLIIGGHHIDEVMTSLNSVSIAETGRDICGEKLPVYFDTWIIGGQSPMATYLSAITIKLFGFNLFGERLPMLIISLIGFAAFVYFVEEVFKNTKYALVMQALACVSPWMLFSGSYLLDCNYIAHFIIIGLFFLAKAIKNHKMIFYVLSMISFSLCFYSYMASVLIVPVIIAAIYLALIVKKKINFKEIAVSVITVFIFSLPFILFGLVVLKVIPSFTLFGFSFSEMPYYARASSVSITDSGVLDSVKNCIVYAVEAWLYLFAVDIDAMALGLNIFQFGNCLGGLFLLIGIIGFTVPSIKRTDKFSTIQKIFLFGTLLGAISFTALVARPTPVVLYRYGVLTFLLIPFEAIGITELASGLKKINFKKALSIYICLSLLVFNVEFFTLYTQHIKGTPDYIYGDSIMECFDKAKQMNKRNIKIYLSDEKWQTKQAVYAQYSMRYDNYPFLTMEEAYLQRNVDGKKVADVTKDSSITTYDTDDFNEIIGDFCIVSNDSIDKVKYDNSYTVEQHGIWYAIYK